MAAAKAELSPCVVPSLWRRKQEFHAPGCSVGMQQPWPATAPPERRRAAAKLGVPLREYSVFHELLTDVLHSAGLPGPAKELAKMSDDGTGRGSHGTSSSTDT